MDLTSLSNMAIELLMLEQEQQIERQAEIVMMQQEMRLQSEFENAIERANNVGYEAGLR